MVQNEQYYEKEIASRLVPAHELANVRPPPPHTHVVEAAKTRGCSATVLSG